MDSTEGFRNSLLMALIVGTLGLLHYRLFELERKVDGLHTDLIYTRNLFNKS